MMLWKQEMTQKSLITTNSNLTEEIERLQKVHGISDSIARLPSVCLENLNNAEEVR